MSDYTHRRHVGNVGDVWKHLAWHTWLARLAPDARILDTHAGEGAYRLGRTGEWQAGWGKVPSDPQLAAWQAAVASAPDAALPPAADGSRTGPIYPGSAWLARERTLHAVEASADAAAVLRRVVPGARVTVGDGLAVLQHDGADLAIVDPPYVRREEWDEVPAAIAAAKSRFPRLAALVWYPIKAFSRPHQLQHALRRAGVAATALDLVSTPVELRKNALAGSGIVLIDPPTGLVRGLVSAAGVLGPALATRPPAWELRVTAWGGD
jgi:23S rRNA (adenine2030-N6)-methyltransferase